MWVVYDCPADMPGKVVARRHEVTPTGSRPTADVIVGAALQDVRDQLPPGLFWMRRDAADEPHIVEVWL